MSDDHDEFDSDEFELEHMALGETAPLFLFMVVVSLLGVVAALVEILVYPVLSADVVPKHSWSHWNFFGIAVVTLFGLGIWSIFRSEQLYSIQNAVVFLAASMFSLLGSLTFFDIGYTGYMRLTIELIFVLIFSAVYVWVRRTARHDV